MNSLRVCDYSSTALCILGAERCNSVLEKCNKENEELTQYLLEEQAKIESEEKETKEETRPSKGNLWEILYTPYIFLIIIIVVVLIILLVIYCIKGYIESKYEAELKKALEKRQQYSNTNSVKSMRSNRKYQNEERYESNDRETGYFSNGDDLRLNNHRFNESATILSGTRNYRQAYTDNNFDYDSVNAQLISPIVSPTSPMYNPPTLAYSPIPHSTVATSQLASNNEYIYYDPVSGAEYNTNAGSVYLSSPKAAQVARSIKNNARSQTGTSPYNANYYNASEALYSGDNKNGKRSVVAYNNYDNDNDSYDERKSSTRQGYQTPERNDDQEDDDLEPKNNMANTTNFSLATTNSSSKLEAANFRIATTESSSKLDNANFRIATTESSSKLDNANFRIATTKSSSKEDLSDESYLDRNIQNEHEQHDNNVNDNNENDENANDNNIKDNDVNNNSENDENGNGNNVNDNVKNQVMDTTRNTSNPVLSKAELAKRESNYIKAHKKKIPVLVDKRNSRKRQSYHSVHSNVPLTNRNSVSMTNLVQLSSPTIVPVQSQYAVVQNAIPNEQYFYEASSSSNNVVQPGRTGSSNKRGKHLSMVSVQSIPTAVYVTDDNKQVYVTPLVTTNDNQNIEYVNYVDNTSDINEVYNYYSNPSTPVNFNGVTYIPASSSVNVQPHIGASPLIAPHSPNFRVITQRNLPVDGSPYYTSSVHTVSPYIKDINRAEINHIEHNDSDQVSTNQYANSYVGDEEAGETEVYYEEEDTNEDAPPPYTSQ